ncbi:hypothetical protein MBM_01510 [Drepanopeziza brunnea f. sp. 'multigermtubi' MB_m1]|uniref:Uncharacterized protein n=1 Tax=Marssonina brunnea f. sp. multigermtubi (strain MB_m1) TaxID=1072389 RepID=K1XJF7_MARBU|nr:uncharacterized protein MBM_01510 [Drepanopeziza brunnea f. sp. 'multigermtubi' MB_m1]EKD20828.1 hypothetical protein MBM_01510 [Drepanopeziza brunnea f. sp. 'multigermtubi' MB_m1]
METATAVILAVLSCALPLLGYAVFTWVRDCSESRAQSFKFGSLSHWNPRICMTWAPSIVQYTEIVARALLTFRIPFLTANIKQQLMNQFDRITCLEGILTLSKQRMLLPISAPHLGTQVSKAARPTRSATTTTTSLSLSISIHTPFPVIPSYLPSASK